MPPLPAPDQPVFYPLPVPPLPKGADAPEFGAWWDEGAARAATAFFPRYLRHTEGEWAGDPFQLSWWQRDHIIRPIFGWKRADGTRLIRIAWIEVPRKNGKTELAAGVALLCLVGDGEFGGQGYSIATQKEQASISFDKAKVMVNSSPALGDYLATYATSVFCARLNASFKPLPKGFKGLQGKSPSFAIGDEVHEWTDGGEALDAIHKGMGARRQPLEFLITTAGVSDEGFAWEMHELAEQVQKGEVIDPTMLVVIYTAGEDDDKGSWKTEAAWRRANPGLGVSPKLEFIRKECQDAARSPRKENAFKRYHLNMWTEQITRWLPMDDWNACTEQPKNKKLWAELFERQKGKACYGGLDLAETRDIAAESLVFPPDADCDRWVMLWRFWCPARTIAELPLPRQRRYESFAASGALNVTEGNVVDYDLIEAQLHADREAFDLRMLGADPWNATQLCTNLMKEDFPVFKFRQGFKSMNGPAKEFERLVIAEAKGIEHGNHPVARWMARNVAVDTDPARNIKPVKPNEAAKIDGIVSAIMGLGLAISPSDDETVTYDAGDMGVDATAKEGESADA